MVTIRDTTRLRVVISYGLISNTLIKLIIQVETILTARQRVIIVLLDLVVCQFLCPEATFVDDTRISLVITSAISIPKSRFRQVIPICRQNGINHLICTWIWNLHLGTLDFSVFPYNTHCICRISIERNRCIIELARRYCNFLVQITAVNL